MKFLSTLAALACLFSQPALAAPTNGTEGVWVGSCAWGQVTVPATISIDQQGARLNNEGVTSFSKNGLTLTFMLQG